MAEGAIAHVFTAEGELMNELKTLNRGGLILAPAVERVRSALELWLAGFASENTRRAYRKEIEAFAAFAGRPDVAEAVAHFLALEDGQAHAVADAWRAAKVEKKLSPASINRSMAALNSLVGSARRHGLTALRLEARGVKSKPYRDTRGPGVAAVQAMLEKAEAHRNPEKAARDTAILRLAFNMGLRRSEIASLDLGHVDLAGRKLYVLGKGHTEREALTIPTSAKHALADWLKVRGTADKNAPLFVALDNHSKGGRLSNWAVYDIVGELGKAAGVEGRVKPHGIRHTAITRAIDALNGDYRSVKSFSRHASIQTIMRYDDNAKDGYGKVARALDAVTA
jgi:integrase/recombinase XerC